MHSVCQYLAYLKLNGSFQAQNIQMNGSFSAYLLHETPKLKRDFESHTMLRHMRLRDDVKEYWGFFLQKGSIVTINLCTRLCWLYIDTEVDQ